MIYLSKKLSGAFKAFIYANIFVENLLNKPQEKMLHLSCNKLLRLLAFLLLRSFEVNCLCKDFTWDDCNYYNQGPFRTIITPEERNCQKMCLQSEQNCEFFIFDRTQKFCDLYDYSLDEVDQYCNKIGGPPEPDVGDCDSNLDLCLVILDSILLLCDLLAKFNFHFRNFLKDTAYSMDP